MARVAINGLGRIGRATLKNIMETPELELVAVNDIADIDNIAYLLKYDSVYGRWQHEIETRDGELVINGQSYPYLSERDPANLPWGDHNIDLVFECTGFFTTMDDASKHIHAGAEYVIISAPTKSDDVPTIIHGVNTASDEKRIISCASCTTNNIGPVMEVMNRRIGVEKAIMTTIHAYTSSQAIVDSPSKKDYRRGRAAAVNFVPTSTGAAKAVTKALPELEGRFDGVAVRGPIPVGSISDIVIVTSRDTTVEEINSIFHEEAESDRYRNVLGVTDVPLVSSDIVGMTLTSLVDTSMTQVVAGNLVKVMTWYDNEWSYTSQMIRQAVELVRTSEKI